MATSLPPSLARNKTAVTLAKQKDNAVSRSRSLKEQLESPIRVIAEGAITLGSSFGAGIVDSYAPAIPLGSNGASVPASLGLGLVTGGAALATGSTKMASATIGFLAPHSYVAGLSAAARMKGQGTDDSEDAS